MNEIIDVIVIGAGASGLMVASKLQGKKSFLVLDTNSTIGAKIKVSGGGKCNITNEIVEATNYLGDKYFIDDVLRNFDQYGVLEWLNDNKLSPLLRPSGQYFCKNSSSEIINIFKKSIDSKNILLNHKVTDVSKRGDIFEIKCDRVSFRAKSLVVASGGLSFSTLGASDIGFNIASTFKHTINKLSPALVGLTLQKEQFFFKELSGISTTVNVRVGERVLSGDMLFTHKGISGPVILDTSLYWNRGEIEIDFLPNFNIEPHQNSNKAISKILPIPRSLSKAMLNKLNIQDIAISKMTKSDIDKLYTLKNYRLSPAGNFGYSKAEVTKGGVATDEVNPKSMMSRLVDNLYFTGEVLNITGQVGGYNFQWAFSSGVICANDILKQSSTK
jgi:hypothetical protein